MLVNKARRYLAAALLALACATTGCGPSIDEICELVVCDISVEARPSEFQECVTFYEEAEKESADAGCSAQLEAWMDALYAANTVTCEGSVTEAEYEALRVPAGQAYDAWYSCLDR